MKKYRQTNTSHFESNGYLIVDNKYNYKWIGGTKGVATGDRTDWINYEYDKWINDRMIAGELIQVDFTTYYDKVSDK